jgi:UDP-N-acetylglucosamine transferase subunit ALG13
MIFVTVGTNEAPFDRLVRAIDRLPAAEEVVAQCGPSSHRPARAVRVDYLAFEELVELVRRARVVVTHAGAGSTMVALANSKRPVVVPRLQRYGEAVDDHQLPFARRLASRRLVTLVEDLAALPETVAAVRDGAVEASVVPDEGLVDVLRRSIDAALTEGRGHARSRKNENATADGAQGGLPLGQVQAPRTGDTGDIVGSSALGTRLLQPRADGERQRS